MKEIRTLKELIQFSLTYKKPEPLSESQIEEIKFIQTINVEGFSEADVRAEIIDPIIKHLGYKHGTYSSVKREKNIQFLGKKNKYIDYSILLWEENFWLIEAKKPIKPKNFRYADLSQAVEYSVHPNINSVLIVLCDGQKLEIFDREESLTEPVLHIQISDLLESFEMLQILLSPLQSWFYYKRRVLKVLDKAFDKEFNQQRVNEFSDLIKDKLLSKRSLVLKNFQQKGLIKQDNWNDKSNETLDDIIDILYFITPTNPSLDSMNNRLIELSINKELFFIPYKMFPRLERDYNANYICHSLLYYMKADQNNIKFQYLPKTDKNDLKVFIKYLIELTLNFSDNDPNKKVILLASDTYRRINKVLCIANSQKLNLGKIEHLSTRYMYDEFSWEQILSSSNRNILRKIDLLTLEAVTKFTRNYQDDKSFKVHLAIEKLKSLWSFELKILTELKNYNSLRKELNLGEMFPTEHCSVSHDYLGHYALVIIKKFPEWEEYALKKFNNEINTIANLGSWSARKLLEQNILNYSEEKKHELAAERFFYGDKEIQKKLYHEYTKT
ncbi:MAG: type I restriction enzyme HsdR N-terminal domain-containing protein [Spirochaetaceae bacterium]